MNFDETYNFNLPFAQYRIQYEQTSSFDYKKKVWYGMITNETILYNRSNETEIKKL